MESPKDCQVVLGLTDEATYRVIVDGRDSGMMDTGRGGKLVLSIEVGEERQCQGTGDPRVRNCHRTHA